MFLTFLLLQALNIYASLYVVYPRAGTAELEVAPQFNRWWKGLQAMLQLAVENTRRVIDQEQEINDPLLPSQVTGVVVFTAIYTYAVVLLVVLLLRLLMAMLTATFNGVRKESQLEWRLQLARQVLRAELVLGCVLPNSALRVGEADGTGRRFVSFLGCGDPGGVDVWTRMRRQLGEARAFPHTPPPPPPPAPPPDDAGGGGAGGGASGEVSVEEVLRMQQHAVELHHSDHELSVVQAEAAIALRNAKRRVGGVRALIGGLKSADAVVPIGASGRIRPGAPDAEPASSPVASSAVASPEIDPVNELKGHE